MTVVDAYNGDRRTTYPFQHVKPVLHLKLGFGSSIIFDHRTSLVPFDCRPIHIVDTHTQCGGYCAGFVAGLAQHGIPAGQCQDACHTVKY
ncbi:hypothetical protein TNCV_3668551 [Trichonephila clavipes]|nr:hypothetical protein TNCV_3668551 [Trichonephila clavipes]